MKKETKMTRKGKGARLTKKQAERCREALETNAVEIAYLIQDLIRRRIERALKSEKELDEFMKELLYHAENCDDKSRSKAIVSKFEAIRIEDLTKLTSVLKTVCQWEAKKDPTDGKDENMKQLRFEDIYDL